MRNAGRVRSIRLAVSCNAGQAAAAATAAGGGLQPAAAGGRVHAERELTG